MSDCCPSASDPAPARQRECPANGRKCPAVPMITILHHLRKPWQWTDRKQGYYFCEDPDCAVVYFGDGGAVILKSELRTVVGIKEKSPDASLCYCFGISKSEASSDPALEEYVIANTRMGLCSCEIRNPSGRCCLKDFPNRRRSRKPAKHE
jgi:hypothetical protein